MMNILYLHSHDTGRHIQPFGHAVAMPHLQKLAESGVLFRNNHCICPTCSPSRSALLTGTYPHQNGMMGLAHRGFKMHDYRQHLIHTLKPKGYRAVLSGTQHIATRKEGKPQPQEIIGYDEYLGGEENAHLQAAEWLSEKRSEPFFLSVGFHETHRKFPEDTGEHDPRYTLPPAPLPDTPQTRLDMARYRKMAQTLDQKMGVVLDALERNDLSENTLVICTTDHGLAFPHMKCSLTDAGTGTFLIMRGPKPEWRGGKVIDAMTTHLDIFPTICDLLDIPPPDRLQGKSLVPLLTGADKKLHEVIYTEVTYHASYEPCRALRTDRYKYIRRFGSRTAPTLPNTDGGPSKDLLLEAGWARHQVDEERLHDLIFDPNEQDNLALRPEYTELLQSFRRQLETWMQDTQDPLLDGPVLPPDGASISWSDSLNKEVQVSVSRG